MKKMKLWRMLVGVLLIQFLPSQVYAQSLSEVYVSPSGNVLGAIFDSNPGFSSDIYVNNSGLLVWVETEIPHALIEIYSDGYIRLIQEDSSANIVYESGRIRQLGDLRFHYESGRIDRIGNVRFAYETGQLRQMGDLRFQYDENGRIRQIGDVRFDYVMGRLRHIGGLQFDCDENGRVRNIGGVRFDYQYGSLKGMIGNISGVSITVTSVVEFRKKLQKRY